MLNQQYDFYVSLPSNSSQPFFPENKPSSYKTKLAREIRLEGQWEVGLTEISYPQTMKSNTMIAKMQVGVYRRDDSGSIKEQPISGAVKASWFKIPNLYGETDIETEFKGAHSVDIVKLEIPVAKYTSHKSITDLLNKQVTEQVEKLKTKTNQPLGKVFEFGYSGPRNRFFIDSHYEDLEFYFYSADELVRMLGLPFVRGSVREQRIVDKGEFQFPKTPVLNIVNSLYIYSDIIEDDIVGDALVPLLRTVNISGEPGAIINEKFHRIYYKRVNRSNISTMEIQINSEKGDQVKFESGYVLPTLHFRKDSAI